MKIKKLNELARFESSKLILSVSIGDDWSGLYCDGQLVTDGHSIRYDESIIGLIQMGINLKDYKIGDLEFQKDGKYYELRESDNDELGLYNCPKTLDELIEMVSSIGINVKIGRLYPQ